MGSLPITIQLSNLQEIETRKLTFVRGEIDKTTLHKTKPRKTFAEDGRMKAFDEKRRLAQENSLGHLIAQLLLSSLLLILTVGSFIALLFGKTADARKTGRELLIGLAGFVVSTASKIIC
jgi:hypothetical protein